MVVGNVAVGVEIGALAGEDETGVETGVGDEAVAPLQEKTAGPGMT